MLAHAKPWEHFFLKLFKEIEEYIIRLASVKWSLEGSCVSTDCPYDAWQSTSNFWHESLPQLLSIFVFFLHLSLKFWTLPVLANELVCPQGACASYLLRLSSNRYLHEYLVELFVERLFAGHEVKPRMTLDCLWCTLKGILNQFLLEEKLRREGLLREWAGYAGFPDDSKCLSVVYVM